MDVESNAGGGGERVLWTAIASMHRTEPDHVAVVYSGDTEVSKEEIIARVKVNMSFVRSVSMTGTLLPEQVRHHTGPHPPSLCLSEVASNGRGLNLATVHLAGSKHWFHLSCFGSNV